MLWVDLVHPQFFLKICDNCQLQEDKGDSEGEAENDKVIKYGNRNYPPRFFVDLA